MADGDYISNRADIEKIFGRENIKRWGNPDNNDDISAIEERVDWANEYAEQEVLGRMAEGPYDIVDIRTIKPKTVIYVCACIAGIMLYDERRVVDADPESDEVGVQRKKADNIIAQIMSGQMKLLDPTTYVPLSKTAQNSPSVVSS